MHALTTTIQMKDAQGRIIGEKEVATYAGLLSRAHEEGLKGITTRLVQIPDEGNHFVAICIARVTTDKGVFTGIGDASPDTVNRKIVPHIIRMAETRAKARALRDAVNIGIVALEELGGEEDDAQAGSPAPAQAPSPPRTNRPPLREVPRQEPTRRSPEPAQARGGYTGGRGGAGAKPGPMTEPQRRLLFRLLADQHGLEGARATDALCAAAEVDDIRKITKDDASALIDQWRGEEAGRG